MPSMPPLDDESAARLHNRLAHEIVTKMVVEPIENGGSMNDIMVLCESVLVGMALKCFELGSDVKVLDIVVGRAKERLARIRLADVETKGHG
jgi:hypothetical protein